MADDKKAAARAKSERVKAARDYLRQTKSDLASSKRILDFLKKKKQPDNREIQLQAKMVAIDHDRVTKAEQKLRQAENS